MAGRIYWHFICPFITIFITIFKVIIVIAVVIPRVSPVWVSAAHAGRACGLCAAVPQWLKKPPLDWIYLQKQNRNFIVETQ